MFHIFFLLSCFRKQIATRLRGELCDIRKEYGKKYFQLQTENNSLKLENKSLTEQIRCVKEQLTKCDKKNAPDTKTASLELKIKRAKEKITALLAENAALHVKSKSADDEIQCLKKENKIMEARAKQFQSGVKQSMCHNRAQQNVERNSDGNATENDYEVLKIIDHKFTNKERKFLVRWKGYNSTHDSWEPESCLSCPKLLKSYLRSKHIRWIYDQAVWLPFRQTLWNQNDKIGTDDNALIYYPFSLILIDTVVL